MPDGRFYIIDDNNKRRYFRKVEDARATYPATQSSDLSPMVCAVLITKTEIRRAVVHKTSQRIGVRDVLGNRIMTGPPKPIVVRIDDSILFKYQDVANTLADTGGVLDADVHPVTCGGSSATPAPNSQWLSTNGSD